MDMANSLIPALPCVCASLRRTTRVLTQVYEDALRSTGLRATQFTVLQALSLTGEVTQGELGRILAMDSTTLTRTLALMNRHGWIAKQRGADRREWRMRLSTAGLAQFKHASPYWQRAQAQVRRRLGDELSDNLMKMADKTTNALME